MDSDDPWEDTDRWGPFQQYSTELLAKVLFNEAVMGIEWDEAEPDTTDERYPRCLLAARAALGGLWETDTPLQAGEPVSTPAASVHHVFRAVACFAHEKMTAYYECAGEGIFSTTSYHMRLRSRAAARRAVASLFGEPAMREAESEFNRMKATLAEEQGARSSKTDTARWHRDGP